MKKASRGFISLCLAICLCFSMSVFAAATDSVKLEDDELLPVTVEGPIDPKIYEMLDSYNNGTFVERNADPDIDPVILFSANSTENQVVTASANEDQKVEYLYDIEHLDGLTYEATAVAVYELEQTSQDEADGVVLFCSIVYEKAPFTLDEAAAYPLVMLKEVKGGVVQNNGNYWCEYLNMRYSVHGDAYDESGDRIGTRGEETDFDDYSNIVSPQEGVAYSIDGPCDYYYDPNVFNSGIAGFTRGFISYRLSSYRNELIVSTGIMWS